MEPTPKRSRSHIRAGQQTLLRFCSPGDRSQSPVRKTTPQHSTTGGRSTSDDTSNGSVDTASTSDSREHRAQNTGTCIETAQQLHTSLTTPVAYSSDDSPNLSEGTPCPARSFTPATIGNSSPLSENDFDPVESDLSEASVPSTSTRSALSVTPTISKSNSTAQTSSKPDQTASFRRACQPHPSSLPKQHLSNKTLTFQQHWYESYRWLHWAEGKLLCLYCSTINPIDNLPQIKKCDAAFITKGFQNWKIATTRFRDHETTDGHTESQKIFLGKNKYNISGRLNKQHLAQQLKSRACLSVIISSLKYLGRQGSAIRGSDNDSGCFIELLRTRSSEVPEMVSWLSRLDNDSARQRHLLSPDIQNEILRDYAHAILRKLQTSFQESTSFSLICDGTQDNQGKEQESVCIRFVDSDLFPREEFVGLYEVEDTSGLNISNVLQDVCRRLQLPMTKLRGQSYDGASNMSGAYSGAQARISAIQPLAYYFHCGAHVVNLAIQDAIGCSDWIRDSVAVVNEVGVLFATTSKYRNAFSKLTSNTDGPKKLKPLCPTRWSLRYEGVSTAVTRYAQIIDSLQDFLTESISVEQKSKANGILSKMEQSATYVGLACAKPLMHDINLLSKILQSDAISLEGTLKAVKTCRSKLQALRDGFQGLYSAAVDNATELELAPVAMPRKRKPPARYTGTADAHQPKTPEDLYRQKFSEVVDTAREGLKNRFKTDGVGISSYLNLLSAFDGKLNKEEISKYPELDYEHLASELPVFQRKFNTPTLTAAADALRNCHKEVRLMFPAVEALVRLLLVRPATSCEAERSFSALRRLKTHLRSTRTAPRLNYVTLMHVHQQLLDTVDDDEIMSEFIMRNNWRKTTFGAD